METDSAEVQLRGDWKAFLLLVLLLLSESAVFFIFVARNVAPFFPPNFDQLVYLDQSYKLAIAARAHGLGGILYPFLAPFLPNGFLLPVQGALLGTLIGSPRAGALAVNLYAFVLLQIGMFMTFKRIADRDLAWLAVAAILMLRSPFWSAGGIYDFRIDFYALCFFGLWSLAILRSEIFLDFKWSVISAIVGVILVCNRFIVFVHIGSILGLVFVVFLAQALLARQSPMKTHALIRSRNILASGAVLLVGALPFLWINRVLIYNYYYQSMFITPEKEIRAGELHLKSLFDHLVYYPWSLLRDHLGIPLVVAIVVTPIIAVVWATNVQRRRPAMIWEDLRHWSVQLGFLGTTILVPLIMLNLSLSKSPVIGGVLCVPVICLNLLLVVAILGLPQTVRESLLPSKEAVANLAPRLAQFYVIIAVAAASCLFLFRASGPLPGLTTRDKIAVNALYDQILTYISAARVQQPVVYSIDRVSDYLFGTNLAIRAYERSDEDINVRGELGHQIWGLERDEALKVLSDSDIVVLTEPTGRRSLYPMDAKIETYWQALWDWCETNRSRLTAEMINGMPHTVFVRPVVRISGTSGPWITSAGILLVANREDLGRWPFIVLQGSAYFEMLGGVPHPTATAVDSMSGEAGPTLPAQITRIGDQYRVVINGSTAIKDGIREVTIRLTFDRFFVPSEKGINSDTRQLVVMEPTVHQLSSIDAH